VEEWGKSQTRIVPKEWRPTNENPDPPVHPRRGAPSTGTLATYYGLNVEKRLARGPVVLQGLAYTRNEAEEIVAAWLKRKAGAKARLILSRAKKLGIPLVDGVPTVGSATAFLAKSESRADKRDT
jgi:hypothetical protein